MEIVYLKDFEKTEVLRGWKTKGMTILDIEAMEEVYNEGDSFPKVYREYLYIGGEHSGVGLDEAYGFDWLQSTAREMLKEYGQKIDRPFFVIDQLDGCEQFGFFYLDENEDDPIIYNCVPPYVEEGEDLISSYKQGKLSKVIKSLIESAKSWDEVRGQYDSD